MIVVADVVVVNIVEEIIRQKGNSLGTDPFRLLQCFDNRQYLWPGQQEKIVLLVTIPACPPFLWVHT